MKETTVLWVPAVSEVCIMDAKTKRLSSDLNKPEALILVEVPLKINNNEERMWPSLTINKL